MLMSVLLLTNLYKYQRLNQNSKSRMNHLTPTITTIKTILLSTVKEAMLENFTISAVTKKATYNDASSQGKNYHFKKIKIIFLCMPNHIMNKYFKSSTVRRV